MTTELWWRNPNLYAKECAERMETHFAWDRGYLVKHNIDPTRWAEAYFGSAMNYRMLAIGEQGAAELCPGNDLDQPRAVYPVWEYGIDEMDILQEILANPVGDDPDICSNSNVPADARPVYGQEHRVVIIRTPPSNTGLGRAFLKILRELQNEYSDAIIHVHGLYSYRVAFGLGFRSADIDPRLLAKKGKVTLPNGKEVTYEKAKSTPHWVSLVGFSPVELEVPRNRCMFNMASARWASENYMHAVKFRVAGAVDADPHAVHVPVPTAGSVVLGKDRGTVGDKITCDTCSLQTNCKYYRQGAVCSIPGSEPVELARFFKTRDSDAIIEGLGTLLAIETKRLETGLENEDFDGELSAEVTKIINTMFDRGVKLAKLINPALAVRANLNLNVGPNGVGAPDMRAVTAQVVAHLESKGVPRNQITPEMIVRAMSSPEPIDAVEQLPPAV